MLKEKHIKSKSRFLFIGSFFLILIGIAIISFKYYRIYESKEEEEKRIDEFIIQQQIEIFDEEAQVKNEEIRIKNDSYIAVLDIPKINLKKGVYSKESSNNNVDINVLLLNESDMPDIDKGNFILAGHSGTGNNAYFKDLQKLDYDDKAYLYYEGNKYIYKLVSKYEIIKNGEAIIHRNMNKKTLTLITCKDNSNKQIVFIFEIVNGGD